MIVFSRQGVFQNGDRLGGLFPKSPLFWGNYSVSLAFSALNGAKNTNFKIFFCVFPTFGAKKRERAPKLRFSLIQRPRNRRAALFACPFDDKAEKILPNDIIPRKGGHAALRAIRVVQINLPHIARQLHPLPIGGQVNHGRSLLRIVRRQHGPLLLQLRQARSRPG